jgi:hypothetical protein
MTPIQYPAAVSCAPDRYDLVIIGGDGRCFENSWHDGQNKADLASKWRPSQGLVSPHTHLYGLNGAPVCAVSRAYGLIETFVIGDGGIGWSRSGRLWHQGDFEGLNWSDKDALSGWYRINDDIHCASHVPISAVARKDDQIDLFATGTDGQVYTSGRSYPSVTSADPYVCEVEGWFDFAPIGGAFTSGAPVAVAAMTPEHLDIFVTGHDHRVYTSHWPAGSHWWSGEQGGAWTSLGGNFPDAAPISVLVLTKAKQTSKWVVAHSPKFILFGTDNEGNVCWRFWPLMFGALAGSQEWHSLGGGFASGAQVTALSRAVDSFDLFVTKNGKVHTNASSPGHPWSPAWQSIGGAGFPATAPITAISRGPDKIDLFAVDVNGRVMTNWNYGTGWQANWLNLGVPQ